MAAFKQELAWASHLSMSAIVLPTPTAFPYNYAHVLAQSAKQVSWAQFMVRVPMMSRKCALATEGAERDAVMAVKSHLGRPLHDSWEWWNTLREMCDHHNNITVALEVTADLPSKLVLEKWAAEPIKFLFVPTSIFVFNKSGFPTLTKGHQEFLLRLFKQRDVQYVLTGQPSHAEGMKVYLQYMHFLWKKRPAWTTQEKYEYPYYNYLQTPLQPLMDNLESQTYEVFEQDPIKYREYENAAYFALLDVKEVIKDRKPIVMVVGAGRGPLVRRVLAASERAGVPIDLYAVEKNPNAVVTLQNAKLSEKWTNVTIVAGDMRAWESPVLADIQVSELLGSFGDNELSPECLDGAQKYLAKGGISIPVSYTSFIAPISTNKVFNEIRNLGMNRNTDAAHALGFETGYVVKCAWHRMLGEPKALFEFVHPNYDDPIDNRREGSAQWVAPDTGMLHGFAGYFDCKLYKDVHISINPPTASEGMFSWFNMFFPIRNPVYVNKGDTIESVWWRNVTEKKVFYEWVLTSPRISAIHNVTGSSYWIGL